MPSSPDHRIHMEEAILALAARQHGVVTRAQLCAAGLSQDAVDRRLESKRLRALHRGVYELGPVAAPRAREMAAVLACGADSAISHRSAAVLREVQAAGTRHASAPVDVAAAGRCRPPAGVRLHRVHTLPESDVTLVDGIPVTTVARTLLDLAATAPQAELERALAQALALRLTSRADLGAWLEPRAHTRGAARLRGLLGSVRTAFTRSTAEERFLALVRNARLPLPEVNVQVCDYEVDFFWPRERFVVEMDGFAFHANSRTFESDRRRDAVLAAAGVRVMRVTWHQVTKEPVALAVRLAQALAQPQAVGHG